MICFDHVLCNGQNIYPWKMNANFTVSIIKSMVVDHEFAGSIHLSIL